MKPNCSLRRALDDPNLLGTALAGDSWTAWRVLLLPCGRTIIAGRTGHLPPFHRPLQSALQAGTPVLGCNWPAIGQIACCGRSSGLFGRAMRLPNACRGRTRGDPGHCAGSAPGIGNSKLRSGQESPILRQRIVRQTSDLIELDGGIVIEVRASSFRRLRGMTCLCVIADECAFWFADETSSNPDVEIIGAIKPALLTTGGPLIGISSPYARKGVLWEAYSAHFGPDAEPTAKAARKNPWHWQAEHITVRVGW